jgi:hypothetical protein
LEQVARALHSRHPALKIAIGVADLSDPEAIQRFLQQLKQFLKFVTGFWVAHDLRQAFMASHKKLLSWVRIIRRN